MTRPRELGFPAWLTLWVLLWLGIFGGLVALIESKKAGSKEIPRGVYSNRTELLDQLLPQPMEPN